MNFSDSRFVKTKAADPMPFNFIAALIIAASSFGCLAGKVSYKLTNGLPTSYASLNLRDERG